MSGTKRKYVLAWIYATLGILYLLPIWLLRFFPSQDGPLHISNAYYLFQILFNHSSHISHYFTLNLAPIDNWFTHLLLVAEIYFVSPTLAEKLMLSLYIVSMMLAVRYAFSYSNNPYPVVFFVFPLIYNYTVDMGLYDFSFGIVLFIFIIGYWMRHHAKPSLTTYLCLMALLSIDCILHVMVFLFTVIMLMCIESIQSLHKSIGPDSTQNLCASIKELFSKTLRILLTASPSLLIVVLFALKQKKSLYFIQPFTLKLIPTFVFALTSFSSIEKYIYVAYIILIFISFYHHYNRNGVMNDNTKSFIYLCLICIICFIISPVKAMGGTLVPPRFVLFFYLLTLFAIAGAPVTGMAKSVITCAAICISIGYLINMFLCMQLANGKIESFLQISKFIEYNSTVLLVDSKEDMHPCNDSIFDDLHKIDSLLHADGYLAIDRKSITLFDCEAHTNYFPLHFKTGYDIYKSGFEEGYNTIDDLYRVNMALCKHVDVKYIIFLGSNCTDKVAYLKSVAYSIGKDVVSTRAAGNCCLYQLQ